MKQLLTGLATVALIAAVLFLSRGTAPTPADPAAAATTPEACVEQMLAAADRGDIDAYLDFFTGPKRTEIERELARQPREAFARSLAAAQSELKGRSVQLAALDGQNQPAKTPSSDTAEVTVERIYTNHNERQTYVLRQTASGWKIEALRGGVNFQPPIPYGTPVWAEAANK